MPEIVEDGLTGFIVKDEIEASDAIRNRLGSLSRTRIRARFEERFTARRMANEYLEIYRKLVTNEVPRLRLIKA